MGVTKALVLAVLCATAAHAGSAGEGEHGARLEARVEAALERMFGPGRAAVTVEVHGTRVTKREQSSISGSGGHEAPPEAAVIDLPGYTKSSAARAARPAASGPLLIHADVDETLSEGSFVVSSVHAWLVLDSKLKEGAVAEAVRVTGEIIGLDPSRGDELSVVRTSFLPSWRAAFSRPRDARNLALLFLAAAAFVLAAGLIGRAAMRSSRTLAEAIAKGRAPASGLPSAALPLRRILPLPPLGKGGRTE
jgi:hypothetical protein